MYILVAERMNVLKRDFSLKTQKSLKPCGSLV